MGIIAGIHKKFNSGEVRATLAKMFEVQRHRDPKGKISSIVFDEDIAIGGINHFDPVPHLSDNLQATSGKHNPGESIHAFVDGIVLEVAKLKQELERSGLTVSPASSSVVVSAYSRWGLDFMSHLEGEFSCAIWDQKNQILVLARDPHGLKPLHYFAKSGSLIFSSEIKGLLAAGIPHEIDLTSLSDFLSLNCFPYPATIFKNVFQVPPGSLLIADNDGVRIKTYWQPAISIDKSITLDDAVSLLSKRLKCAVEKRMVSDEVYCFLSGGLDSSAIVSLATEVSGKTVHAVSVGFEDEEANELQDAAIMAKHAGVKLHQVIAQPDSFFDILDTLILHHDSPFTDTSAYPTFFAAKLASQFTDIILTGDGPDQSMGGSSHHVFAVKNDIFSHRTQRQKLFAKFGVQLLDKVVHSPTPTLLSKVHRKFYRNSISPVHYAYDLRSYFPDIVKKFLCSEDLWEIHVRKNPYRHPESWFEEAAGLDDINKYLYADMKFYGPDDLMTKVDRMCMAQGLETLCPFYDLKLAAIVNKLPGNYKIKTTERGEILTKFILRKICENRFPKHILTKRKQGFGIPLEKWLKQNNGSALREILLDSRSLNRKYFKKDSLEKFVKVFLQDGGDYFFPGSHALFGLLTLELWHQKYLD